MRQYDGFGNTTSIKVGTQALAQYVYALKNGNLQRCTYGNGAYTDYTYDRLNRVAMTKTYTISNGNPVLSAEYRYTYNGEGQLFEVTDYKYHSNSTTYRYSYDTLGRLIGITRTTGSQSLRSAYTYDEESRLKKFTFSIPGVIDSAEESYYYNNQNSDNYNENVSAGGIDLHGDVLWQLAVLSL